MRALTVSFPEHGNGWAGLHMEVSHQNLSKKFSNAYSSLQALCAELARVLDEIKLEVVTFVGELTEWDLLFLPVADHPGEVRIEVREYPDSHRGEFHPYHLVFEYRTSRHAAVSKFCLALFELKKTDESMVPALELDQLSKALQAYSDDS